MNKQQLQQDIAKIEKTLGTSIIALSDDIKEQLKAKKKSMQDALADIEAAESAAADAEKERIAAVKEKAEKKTIEAKEKVVAKIEEAKEDLADAKKSLQKAKKKAGSIKLSPKLQALLNRPKNKEVKAFYKGTSAKNLAKDASRKADPPGKRTSKDGNVYYEYRSNKTDINQKLKLEKGGRLNAGDSEHKYYRTYANATKEGIVLYSTDGDEETEILIGDYKTIDEAKKAAEKLNLQPLPIYMRFENGGNNEMPTISFFGYPAKYLNKCEGAVDALAKAKDYISNESNSLFDVHSTALRNIVQYVDEILASPDDKNLFVTNLQLIGVQNLKTGMIVDTRFLNNCLTDQQFQYGGFVTGRSYKTKNGDLLRFVAHKGNNMGLFLDSGNYKRIDYAEFIDDKPRHFEKGGAVSDRINEMVESWNKDGKAFSHINNDDDAFFAAIGQDQMNVGVTSQTGSDLLYYDTNIYNSDSEALKSKKKSIKAGDIVKFANPYPDEDPNMRYKVLEAHYDVEKPRALIQAINTNLNFPPQNTVLIAELLPVTEYEKGGLLVTDSISEIDNEDGDEEIRVYKSKIREMFAFIGEGMDIEQENDNEVHIEFTENAWGGIEVKQWHKCEQILASLIGKNGVQEYIINPSHNKIVIVFDSDIPVGIY